MTIDFPDWITLEMRNHAQKGASHLYLEALPEEWPRSTVRRVIEKRDDLQRSILNGADPELCERELIEMVRAADRGSI